MSKKNKKKKRIDTTADERMTHNPFADLLGDSDKSDLPEGPDPEEIKEATSSKPTLEERLQNINKVVLRRQRKGRGGKTVTVVEKLDELSEEQVDELASQMRKALGTGATLEDGDIVLQGDQRDRAEDWLSDRGVKKIVT